MNMIWVNIIENICVLIIMKFFLKMLNTASIRKINNYFFILIIALTPFSLALPYILFIRYFNIQSFANYICIFIFFILTFGCDYFLFSHAKKLENQLKTEISNNLKNQFYLHILQQSIEFKEETSDYRAIRHDLINYIEKQNMEENHHD